MNVRLSLLSRTALCLLLAGAFFAGSLLSRSSAQTKPAQPIDPDHAAKMARGTEVFKQHVRPVLLAQCLRCHGGKKTESEFDLHDRDNLLRGGLKGAAVIPGKAKDSMLLKLIAHQAEPNMPEGGKKLPDETIKRFAEWIDLGAPYDKPLLEKDDVAAWTRKVVPAEARAFWSFQPLRRVEPPAIKDAQWVRTPVDRFILAKLEAAGVRPNDRVDKRQLIRRAYLDLIGMPPPPTAVDAFLKDETPDAFAKVVDGLLQSPHYGERWGRHWLDLARFAESHGFEHDYDRPSAYHYRDFVIQALNEDLPYDTFIKWQIAGDELAPDNALALKATGFLAAGVHSTQITQREVEKHRYDEMDDKLATIGTSMLGLTFGCARCHDHKYDPIPQRDYYQMLSTFTTTVRSEVELPIDMDVYKAAKAAFDVEHAPLASELKKFETEQLPGRLAKWLADEEKRKQSPPWIVPELASSKSEGGATFVKQPDGSLLATGTNPANDTYTFVVHTDLRGITGIRLDALSHPSLVKSGPGRAANGNFALTEMKVTSAPRKGGPAVPVKLKNARATFEQKGLPVAAAIDDNTTSGWAVDPQFGKDHSAAFDIEAPISHDGGTILTFSLRFQNNTQHSIGRPRLALTTEKNPIAVSAPSIPETIRAAFAVPAERRTPVQQDQLLRWYATQDAEWQRLTKKVQEHLTKSPKQKGVKALICSEGLPAVRLHTQGGDFLKDTHFLRRGDADQKVAVAQQGFLQVLANSTDGTKHWQTQPPPGARTSYRRVAMANWLTDTEKGAGHLLARVIVNRLWQHHMGRGLVATPSDFGIRGEKPTHPELLDFLASELIRNNWKLKPIHKLIVTSSVYAQSSRIDPERKAKDPDNRLLWRRPAMRLEAEAVRDSLLSIGGVLDATMYGPGTLDELSRRRSIYFTVKRSKLITVLQVFDAPDATVSIGERPETTVAPQALLLMNNPQVRAACVGFAKRIAPDDKTKVEDAVSAAYRIALTREPTKDELADGIAFIQAQEKSYGKDGRAAAVADFCQVLMCLNEFIYVD